MKNELKKSNSVLLKNSNPNLFLGENRNETNATHKQLGGVFMKNNPMFYDENYI